MQPLKTEEFIEVLRAESEGDNKDDLGNGSCSNGGIHGAFIWMKDKRKKVKVSFGSLGKLINFATPFRTDELRRLDKAGKRS